jgi:hypothetical protein
MVRTWDISPFGSRYPKGKLATFEEKKVFKAAYPLKSFSKGPPRNNPKVFSLVPGRLDKVKIIETISYLTT